ncbi:MAG: hypothetical protein AAB524_01155 [Patescibacteria group bacterium]
MITEERARILSNFFLDGAKILFGSLVVGTFLSSAEGSLNAKIGAILVGFIATGIFLAVSMAIMREKATTKS